MDTRLPSLASAALTGWRRLALAVLGLALLAQIAARLPGHAVQYTILAAIPALAVWGLIRLKRRFPSQTMARPGLWPWLRRAGWLALATAAVFVLLVVLARMSGVRPEGQSGLVPLKLTGVATLALAPLWFLGWVFLAPEPSTGRKRRRLTIWSRVFYGLGFATVAAGFGTAVLAATLAFFDLSAGERGWMILVGPLYFAYAMAVAVPAGAAFGLVGWLIARRAKRL